MCFCSALPELCLREILPTNANMAKLCLCTALHEWNLKICRIQQSSITVSFLDSWIPGFLNGVQTCNLISCCNANAKRHGCHVSLTSPQARYNTSFSFIFTRHWPKGRASWNAATLDECPSVRLQSCMKPFKQIHEMNPSIIKVIAITNVQVLSIIYSNIHTRLCMCICIYIYMYSICILKSHLYVYTYMCVYYTM